MRLAELFRRFPDDEAAERWFVEQRWPHGVACTSCGSLRVQHGAKHPSMPYRCRDCGKRFSVRSGSVLEASNLGYQTWALAIFLLTTTPKGISSVQLGRYLGITQKSAWHLAHRLREGWRSADALTFRGPVEADETFVGGRYRNMHAARRRTRPPKAIVAGVRDRFTGKVSAEVVPDVSGETLVPFVMERSDDGAVVFTDELRSYDGLPRVHRSVRHSAGQYVDGMAHTHGIESLWSLVKRAHKGTYHYWSAKHLQRYVREFCGRNNQWVQGLDAADRMRDLWRALIGKRLPYAELVA